MEARRVDGRMRKPFFAAPFGFLERLRGLRPILGSFYRRLLILSVLGLVASLVEGLAVSFVTLLLVIAVGGAVDVGGGVVGGLLQRLVSMTGGTAPLLGVAIVMTIVLKAALATANQVLSETTRYEVYHRLRRDIFSTYLDLPYDRFTTSDRGALLNTLEAETWNVSEAIQCVFRIAVNVAPAVVFGALILAVDWKVGFGVGVVGLAMLGLVTLARGPSRLLSRSAQTHNEALAEQAYTAIVGMRTIRILGQEERTRQLFGEGLRKSKIIHIEASGWRSTLCRRGSAGRRLILFPSCSGESARCLSIGGSTDARSAVDGGYRPEAGRAYGQRALWRCLGAPGPLEERPEPGHRQRLDRPQSSRPTPVTPDPRT